MSFLPASSRLHEIISWKYGKANDSLRCRTLFSGKRCGTGCIKSVGAPPGRREYLS